MRRHRLTERAQDERQRLGRIGELLKGQRADRRDRDPHIDEGADQHRTEDADGQVALRILRFFSRCRDRVRSEEPTSELQSLMRSSSAVVCLQNKKNTYAV